MTGTTEVQDDLAHGPRPQHAALAPPTDERQQWSLLRRIGPVMLTAVGTLALAATVVALCLAARVYTQSRTELASMEASVGAEATQLDTHAAAMEQQISSLRLSADPATRGAEARRLAEAEICDSTAADFDSARADFVARTEQRFPNLARTAWVPGLDLNALRARWLACRGEP